MGALFDLNLFYYYKTRETTALKKKTAKLCANYVLYVNTSVLYIRILVMC